MAYNILGINMGQHGSASLISDGKLVYFLEEERLSKKKRDSYPFKVILDVLSRYKVDEIILAGVGDQSPFLSNTGEDMFTSFVRKFSPNIKSSIISNHHHLTHVSSAFYNSGFENSIGIVIDGCGSRFKFKDLNVEVDEVESTFLCSYNNIEKIYGVYKNSLISDIKNNQYIIQNSVNIAHAYEAITSYLGFGSMEGGKTMGLASYGKYNNKILDFITEGKFNKNLFYFNSHIPNFQSPTLNPSLIQHFPPEDIAWKIQDDTQQLVGDYIEKAIKKTGLKQVCCAGGYFLNCVANYYLVKRFPNIEFYFEPIAHDGGISLGAALYRWYRHSKDTNLYPRKTLYNGPKYSKKELLKGIKKYTHEL